MTRTQYSRDQRRRQIAWKRASPDCEGARGPGFYDGTPCGFILPMEHAALNLWAPIRAEVIEHFRTRYIAWHDEEKEEYGPRAAPGPSPHLLDSQICALNFWWGLARHPASLAVALRSVLPDLDAVAAIEPGEPLVLPEWIGLRNYLGELGSRRRGKFATSADFLIVYLDRRGERHGVLVESKYSESYEPDQ